MQTCGLVAGGVDGQEETAVLGRGVAVAAGGGPVHGTGQPALSGADGAQRGQQGVRAGVDEVVGVGQEVVDAARSGGAGGDVAPATASR